MKPMDIEKESFAIIEKELTTDIPAEYKPVVKRVIHTTADFSYETSMTFSKGVIEEALKAIKEGVDIVTDTNMAKSGISHKMAEKFSCSLNCYMADSDVASEAAKREVTRATVSVEKAAKAAKGDKKFLHEAEVFKALAAHLDAGKCACSGYFHRAGSNYFTVLHTGCGKCRCDHITCHPVQICCADLDPAGLCRLHIGTAQSSGTDLGLWCDIIQVFMLILICNGHHLHLIGTYIKIFHHCILLVLSKIGSQRHNLH